MRRKHASLINKEKTHLEHVDEATGYNNTGSHAFPKNNHKGRNRAFRPVTSEQRNNSPDGGCD